MAKLSSDKSYVTVDYGDTLSGIALKYLGSASKYKQLATWNNISNPDVLKVDQKVYLSKDGASSSGSGNSGSSSSKGLVIEHFGFYAGASDDKTLVATWKWDKDHTDSYKVEWTYGTGTGIWFSGNSSSISVDKDSPNLSKYSTYSVPNNAINVRFRVKPISETRKDKDGNESNYWTHGWSKYKTKSFKLSPVTNGQLTVTPDGTNIKIDLRGINTSATNDAVATTHIIFQIVKNDNAKLVYTTSPISIRTQVASYVYKGAPGGNYKVRYRSYNKKTETYGEWSSYSTNYATIPPASNGITTLRAESSTSVFIKWAKVNTATSYLIEYTTNKNNFNGSGTVESTEIKPGTGSSVPPVYTTITIKESGAEYFFRVFAKQGTSTSTATAIKSVILGTRPAAPTTWSSSSSVIKGSDVSLYWVHNSNDSSRQQLAQLEITDIDGNQDVVTLNMKDQVDGYYIKYTPPIVSNEDEAEPTYSCALKTGVYAAGAKFQWRVRTAGVYTLFDLQDGKNKPAYSEWSTLRTIDIYDPPGLDLKLLGDENGNINSFPLYIQAIATPNNDLQAPIGYQVSICSEDTYETVDNLGNPKHVSSGDELYSKYYNPDSNGELMLELMPNDITLENGMSYKITCVASMNSGLTVSDEFSFAVEWDVSIPYPNASIGINNESLAATIRPYCEEERAVYHRVDYDPATRKYSASDGTVGGDPEVDPLFGEIKWLNEKKHIPCVTDDSHENTELHGRVVYAGMDDDGNELLFCKYYKPLNYTNVYLSVYRREYDGRFTEIITGLDSATPTTVTDPHPALDYARYRIVAIDKSTGAVNYYDTPGYPVHCVSAVLQWDEEWTNFDATDAGTPEQSPWSGSMLKLPYNIDVSDNHKPNCTLVEYIGRSHPVSYYGTHLGSTSSWNMVIDKKDVETLYALRRLARWLGDVYVREPSGSGYWAQVTVSFSQNHCELTIPVSLSITRVEGGV